MLVALHKRVNDKLTFRLRKCPRISATLPGTQRVTRTVVDSGPTVTEGSIVIIFAESVRWARFALHRARTPKRAILIDIAFGGG
jgi:hypothetical protein